MPVTTRTSELARGGGRRKNSHVTRKSRGKCPARAQFLQRKIAANRAGSKSEPRVTSALYSTLRALMQAPGTFAPLFAPRRLGATSDSSSRALVRSPELARQRPNVNPPPRMDSHRAFSPFLSFSLSAVSRPFYSRAGAGCRASWTDS